MSNLREQIAAELRSMWWDSRNTDCSKPVNIEEFFNLRADRILTILKAGIKLERIKGEDFVKLFPNLNPTYNDVIDVQLEADQKVIDEWLG